MCRAAPCLQMELVGERGQQLRHLLFTAEAAEKEQQADKAKARIQISRKSGRASILYTILSVLMLQDSITTFPLF